MEAESEMDLVAKKMAESVNRSAELLATNKHYEFTQKIKSLSQRKAQTNKLVEAEILLRLGVEKMLSQEEVEFNAVHELIVALLSLYESNRTLWKGSSAGTPIPTQATSTRR